MNEIGRLTTHVLDTAHGKPAGGMPIELFRVSGGETFLIKRVVTNADGRCDAPMLEGDAMAAGSYELVFYVGEYFSAFNGLKTDFLDVVPVRFQIAAPAEHYHVPLLVSPYGYSTYRGS